MFAMHLHLIGLKLRMRLTIWFIFMGICSCLSTTSNIMSFNWGLVN